MEKSYAPKCHHYRCLWIRKVFFSMSIDVSGNPESYRDFVDPNPKLTSSFHGNEVKIQTNISFGFCNFTFIMDHANQLIGNGVGSCAHSFLASGPLVPLRFLLICDSLWLYASLSIGPHFISNLITPCRLSPKTFAIILSKICDCPCMFTAASHGQEVLVSRKHNVLSSLFTRNKCQRHLT